MCQKGYERSFVGIKTLKSVYEAILSFLNIGSTYQSFNLFLIIIIPFSMSTVNFIKCEQVKIKKFGFFY